MGGATLGGHGSGTNSQNSFLATYHEGMQSPPVKTIKQARLDQFVTQTQTKRTNMFTRNQASPHAPISHQNSATAFTGSPAVPPLRKANRSALKN